jgi:hypothetical protein
VTQPRKPLTSLKALGSVVKHPERFRSRTEPETVPLGPPSPHLNSNARVAWFSFVSELPWLAESDRAILEIACHVRGRLIAGDDVGAAYLTLLRQTLSALGATPADRSRSRRHKSRPMIRSMASSTPDARQEPVRAPLSVFQRSMVGKMGADHQTGVARQSKLCSLRQSSLTAGCECRPA